MNKTKIKKKGNSKNSNGITLIALIVTIIVLIILAGVTINLLMGDNGILNRAKDTKVQTLIAQYKEQIELVKMEERLKNENEISLQILKNAFDNNEQKYWVNKTEIIQINNVDKIKLTTNDGYVFYITEETTEYKGMGEVDDTPPQVPTAEDIGFTPTDTTWKAKDGSNITSIKQALDYFYED